MGNKGSIETAKDDQFVDNKKFADRRSVRWTNTTELFKDIENAENSDLNQGNHPTIHRSHPSYHAHFKKFFVWI